MNGFQFSGYSGGKRRILSRAYYERFDVTLIAKELLGKVIATGRGRTLTSGVIVETEAYAGKGDRACHASDGKRTRRNEVMYGPGGHAYVYLCYGIHHLLNVVTNREGEADAVLIRALEPLEGLDRMLMRRQMDKLDRRLTSGPGCLTPSLAISIRDNRTCFFASGARIRIEDAGITVSAGQIESGPRIGVGYAGEDAARPWRFWVRGNPWVSG